MTAPLELSVAARRSVGLSFDRQVLGVTVLPWALFLGAWTMRANPWPIALAGAFLGTPHILATFGLYAEPGLRAHVRRNPMVFWVAPVAAVVLGALAFALSPVAVVRILIIAFLVWQTHHFTKQNLGMFVFWAKARGLAGASAGERRVLLATSAIGMTGVVRLYDVGSALDVAMRGAGLVALVGCAVAAVACTDDARRRAALLVAVAFYAPLHLVDVGIFGAAFSYQAAHGAQYLLMVGKATRPTRRSLLVFLVVFVVGGFLIYSQVRPLDPYGSGAWVVGLFKGLVAAHFIADSRFWRLRDAEVRTFMKSRFSFL